MIAKKVKRYLNSLRMALSPNHRRKLDLRQTPNSYLAGKEDGNGIAKDVMLIDPERTIDAGTGSRMFSLTSPAILISGSLAT